MSDGGELVEFLRRIFERRGRQHNTKIRPTPTRVLVLLGSSRRNGNTGMLASAAFKHLEDARLIDLNDLSIAPYDYDYQNGGDDFLPLARAMVDADAIVFASPVYWYSMSAPMKTLFDRLSDLTKQYRPLGRQLAGKSIFVISTSSATIPPESFEAPFKDTARYFNMHWGGILHASFPKDLELPDRANDAAKIFAAQINASIAETKIIAA